MYSVEVRPEVVKILFGDVKMEVSNNRTRRSITFFSIMGNKR